MKIIALADTHIKSGSIIESLPGQLAGLIENADMVIHAGDFVTKQSYDELTGICRLEAVHGNMDELVLKNKLSERKIIKVEGVCIGIIHEAALSIQDTTGAWYLAKEMGVDVLIFGHVHRPLIEKSEVLLVCPGSPTVPRLSEPSAVELNVKGGAVSGKMIMLEGTACSVIESARAFGK